MSTSDHNSDSFVWGKVLAILRRRLLLFIALIIVGGVIGWAVSSYMVLPVYQADASLIVNIDRDGSSAVTTDQLDSASELANLYGVIVKSNTVLDEVIKDNSLSMDYETLSEKVFVSSVENTSVLRISVRDTDPKFALKILKGIVSVSPGIIKKTVEAGSVKVVSAPRLQTEPISPDKTRYTLCGTILSLLLFLAYSLLKVVNESKISDNKDVEGLGLQVLGEIPVIDTKDRRNCILTEEEEVSNTEFSFRESYRYLRMTLYHQLSKDKGNALLVTSAVEGEGKTSVAVNLALSLAADSPKTILLECDLRKPMVCNYLEIADHESKGLADIITGQGTIREAMIKKNGIDIIPAGKAPKDPTLLLNSERMKVLIDVLKKKYDFIVIDTPPSSSLADALAISSNVTGVLFVIKQDYADAGTVADACQKLRASNVNILGAVINFRHRENSRRTPYGYGYKYQ